MKEQIFAFNNDNYLNCQSAYRGANQKEYYSGKYVIDAKSQIDVRADKKEVGATTIVSLQSKSRLFFQRSWEHIREDATDLTALWFLKHGTLNISHLNGVNAAKAGDFGIINSLSPFSMECFVDTSTSLLDVFHVMIPTYLFRCFLGNEIKPIFCSSGSKREFSIADWLFSELFEQDDRLDTRAEQIMLESALSILSEGVIGSKNALNPRQSLSQKRYNAVISYVKNNLKEPELNADSTAKACKISRRYLSYLCKQNNTSFPKLVWGLRLQTAKNSVSNPANSSLSLSQIAYENGFKSPGHFTRLFKQTYNLTPSEYRAKLRLSANP